MSIAWFAAVAFAAALGCYMLLAGSLSWTEFGAGVACAGAVAAFASIHRLRTGRPLASGRPPVAVLGRVLASLAADTVRVGGVLVRALAASPRGAAAWQPFHPGGIRSRDAGRRALATVLASVAPNGFVIDLRPSACPEADHAFLLHRLAPAPPPSGRDWPA